MEQTDARKPQSAHVLLSIQALRCFAVMGVILFHVQHYYTNKLRMPGFLPNFDVGSAGVDLFFVISGFIMVYAFERLFGQPGGTRIFLLRRLARIVPMYWAATTVFLVYVLAPIRQRRRGDQRRQAPTSSSRRICSFRRVRTDGRSRCSPSAGR